MQAIVELISMTCTCYMCMFICWWRSKKALAYIQEKIQSMKHNRTISDGTMSLLNDDLKSFIIPMWQFSGKHTYKWTNELQFKKNLIEYQCKRRTLHVSAGFWLKSHFLCVCQNVVSLPRGIWGDLCQQYWVQITHAICSSVDFLNVLHGLGLIWFFLQCKF